MGGTLAALFGFYYLGAAYGEITGSGLHGFYSSTVLGRLALSGIFLWLRIKGEAGFGLVIIAALNAAGALSMQSALSQNSKAVMSPPELEQ